MSGILTYLTQAEIRDSVRTLQGKLVTAPAPIKTDGAVLTYAADVEISTDVADVAADLGITLPVAPDNDQIVSLAHQLGVPIADSPSQEQIDATWTSIQNRVLAGDPALAGYITNRVLRNVVVAPGNRDLLWAAAGWPVTLTRTSSGTFEISGFSVKLPGTRIRIPVDLGTGVPSGAFDVTLRVRYLTFGEMGSLAFGGGWGTLPWGSYATFQGDILVAVNGIPKRI